MADPTTQDASQPTARPRPRKREAWHLSFARLLGRATRWAADQPDRLTQRRSRPRSDPRPAVDRLVELVKEHEAGDEAPPLHKDRRFWTLVAELYALRPMAKRARRRRPGRPRPKRSAEPQEAAADAVEARVAGSEAAQEGSEASATSDAGPDQTPPEEDASGADADAPDADGPPPKKPRSR